MTLYDSADKPIHPCLITSSGLDGMIAEVYRKRALDLLLSPSPFIDLVPHVLDANGDWWRPESETRVVRWRRFSETSSLGPTPESNLSPLEPLRSHDWGE